jgi:hypothetical protein
MFGEIGFEPFGKFTPGEHDVSSTAFTFKPDIRAKTCYGPFVGAARMLFAKTQVIVELKIRKHVSPRLWKSF